jgi:hypothetical protein
MNGEECYSPGNWKPADSDLSAGTPATLSEEAKKEISDLLDSTSKDDWAKAFDLIRKLSPKTESPEDIAMRQSESKNPDDQRVALDWFKAHPIE